MRLSQTKIEPIKPPMKPRQEDYWDELLPGFGLRVNYSKTKSWMVSVRIFDPVSRQWKQTRLSIGKHPLMTLAEARDRAKEVFRIAQAGKDPRPKKQNHTDIDEETKTFGEARNKFLDSCKKLRTANEYSRVLKSDSFASWENLPLSEITKKDIILLLDGIVKRGSSTMANRTLAYLRSMLNWAVSRDNIKSSPAAGLKAPLREKSRDRWLNENEIRIIWKAFEAAGTYEPVFKFLLVTAQRKEEVGHMSRSELTRLDGDSPLWEIPKERVKMKRPHLVPLSTLGVQIINSVPDMGEFIFTFNGETPLNGYSKPKKRVENRIEEIIDEEGGEIEFPNFRIHDFRRTAVSHLAELGVPRDIVEKIINHQSGTRGGVAGTYNRSELLHERRAALQVWGEYLEKIIQKEYTEEELNNLRQKFRKKYHHLLKGNY